MTNKALELARLIAQRRTDRESSEYLLAVELLRLRSALEAAGQENDGFYRLCCVSVTDAPHSATCIIGNALRQSHIRE